MTRLTRLREAALQAPITTLPAGLDALVELNMLDCTGSALETVPGELARCPKLRYLCLTGSSVATIPDDFLDCADLTFYLANTKVTKERKKELKKAKGISIIG